MKLRARLFWLALGAYTAIAVLLLLLGFLPAIARFSGGASASFDRWGHGTNIVAELARAVTQSSIAPWRTTHLIVDYGLSAVNIALGLFVVVLRPRDHTARLLAFGMIGTAAAFNIQSHAILSVLGNGTPVTLLGNLSGIAHTSLHGLSGLAYLHALLLFPDGRLRPAWTKWPLRAGYLVLSTPAALLLSFVLLIPALMGARLPNTGTLAAFTVADTGWMVLSFGILIPIVGFGSQALRYRTALSATERQQSRLLMLALGIALTVGLLFVALSVGSNAPTELMYRTGFRNLGLEQLTFRIAPPIFIVIPLALFVAILRFHLWDVDRLINRTLVYGLVTALLGAGYVTSVFVLNVVSRPLTGGSDLVIAVSTLAMAAAFRPVRRRIQSVVDRRFNRSHYDAQRTVEEFAARLREEVDLNTLEVELRGVVDRTMQPVTVSLWLRPERTA